MGWPVRGCEDSKIGDMEHVSTMNLSVRSIRDVLYLLDSSGASHEECFCRKDPRGPGSGMSEDEIKTMHDTHSKCQSKTILPARTVREVFKHTCFDEHRGRVDNITFAPCCFGDVNSKPSKHWHPVSLLHTQQVIAEAHDLLALTCSVAHAQNFIESVGFCATKSKHIGVPSCRVSIQSDDDAVCAIFVWIAFETDRVEVDLQLPLTIPLEKIYEVAINAMDVPTCRHPLAKRFCEVMQVVVVERFGYLLCSNVGVADRLVSLEITALTRARTIACPISRLRKTIQR